MKLDSMQLYEDKQNNIARECNANAKKDLELN